MRTMIVLALALATSCTFGKDGAVMELEITLPPAPDDNPIYAFIQARPGEVGFDVAWSEANPVHGYLLRSSTQQIQVSVVAGQDSLNEDVNIRLRYCSNDTCTFVSSGGEYGDDQAAEVQLRVERPFYAGSQTRARWEPPMLEPMNVESNTIGRCEVAGCIGGSPVNYCDASSTHFCEGSSGPAPDPESDHVVSFNL